VDTILSNSAFGILGDCCFFSSCSTINSFFESVFDAPLVDTISDSLGMLIISNS
jgi:hypothetical protein